MTRPDWPYAREVHPMGCTCNLCRTRGPHPRTPTRIRVAMAIAGLCFGMLVGIAFLRAAGVVQ